MMMTLISDDSLRHGANSSLPFTPMNLAFQNLVYTVRVMMMMIMMMMMMMMMTTTTMMTMMMMTMLTIPPLSLRRCPSRTGSRSTFSRASAATSSRGP
jgi:hypothetical protein